MSGEEFDEFNNLINEAFDQLGSRFADVGFRMRNEIVRLKEVSLDVERYDTSVVSNARGQLQNYQRMLWAIVDTATRSGTPVRVSLAAIAAYDTSSKLLIETNDVATSELLLWTDSPRGN